ncbi:MAG: helix-turn-helix domain-containing protein [Firmicutes bacterium]|nr:helix-turn-helix domain-containing protein [Bacillota bacterium]
MDLKLFAKRLVELRTEKSLSVRALGDAIGVSDASISVWENCKSVPSAEAIYKLAKFFGVTSDFLIGLED